MYHDFMTPYLTSVSELDMLKIPVLQIASTDYKVAVVVLAANRLIAFGLLNQ